MNDLAGIVERDAAWPEGGMAAMDADEDGLMFAVNDRRALLALLRETREALGSAHNPHDSSWRCEFPAGTPCECGVADLLARLAALGETR